MNLIEALECAAYIDSENYGYCRVLSVDLDNQEVFLRNDDSEEEDTVSINELGNVTLYQLVEMEYE